MLTRATWIGPWAGLPVAWSDNDRFDEPTYRSDIAACCRAGVPGVYSGGTSGEFYAMELDEFREVARATVEECHAHGTPAMVGCTSTYTLGAIRRAEFAAELGANAVQVALPFWMEIGPAQVLEFYRNVSAAAGGLPLSIYETTRAKRVLTIEQHRKISDALPNYLMVKANVGTIAATPEGCDALSRFVNVFVGEPLWATLGRRGARGGCSSMVYWNPKLVLALWAQVERREWDAVDRQMQSITALHEFLQSEFGPRGLTDTAYDRLGGLASGFLQTSRHSRGPYPAISSDDVEIVRQWCRRHFPEMLSL